jgi:hypothetical protein
MALPTALRQLILLSAGTSARREHAQALAAELAADADWLALARILRARRLLPTLGPRILELAAGAASLEFDATVEESLAEGRRQAALLQLTSSQVSSALAAAGIRSTPLKGSLLAERIYGDPGRRLSGDVDLLVAPTDLQAATEIVCRLGYSPPEDHVDRDGLPLLHFALAHQHGQLPPVELHWRVHWYEQSFAAERLLAPTVASSPDGWCPDPAAELASLLLFYARDGFIDLRLATDLGALWDACADEVPTGALDEIYMRYPELRRVLLASSRVAEKVVGVPAAQLLGGLPALGLRARAAVRLANPHPRSSAAQLYADRGCVDGLLMPAGGFSAFVRRQVFPPRQVLEQRAQRDPRRRLRSMLGPNARLLARCGVLGRYALTMTRAARAPEALRPMRGSSIASIER